MELDDESNGYFQNGPKSFTNMDRARRKTPAAMGERNINWTEESKNADRSKTLWIKSEAIAVTLSLKILKIQICYWFVYIVNFYYSSEQ